ncbi:hypothetical protein MS3_00007900 [Schistosoma haematobium]|uniref:Integrase zinc-binding domain-containing protein n=1 Tax=Schistosoma haematobium TaxID=6185 RepID=A0A922LGS6_SCHHA|nr:hypothetical protein MS3_00007900 [Schistosoma haematobium]KAH9583533.1 hypothetical protein MS3_00007900 [Schistosoma haematobium]
MVRQNDQKVRKFIPELQKQAAKCNFGDQLHVQLRDRSIAGINIPGLGRELLSMPNCSLRSFNSDSYSRVNMKGVSTRNYKANHKDLHSGHLRVEKMKSLAMLTCWWPEINADICRTANNCERCHQFKNQPSK